jgi:predicted HTH domain antitoxin
MMKKLTLEIPEEILISLKEDPQEFAKDILMLSAPKLYEMGKLSSGRAASLTGVSRVYFLQSLSQYNVPIFDLNKEDLKQDLNNA